MSTSSDKREALPDLDEDELSSILSPADIEDDETSPAPTTPDIQTTTTSSSAPVSASQTVTNAKANKNTTGSKKNPAAKKEGVAPNLQVANKPAIVPKDLPKMPLKTEESLFDESDFDTSQAEDDLFDPAMESYIRNTSQAGLISDYLYNEALLAPLMPFLKDKDEFAILMTILKQAHVLSTAVHNYAEQHTSDKGEYLCEAPEDVQAVHVHHKMTYHLTAAPQTLHTYMVDSDHWSSLESDTHVLRFTDNILPDLVIGDKTTTGPQSTLLYCGYVNGGNNKKAPTSVQLQTWNERIKSISKQTVLKVPAYQKYTDEAVKLSPKTTLLAARW